MSQELIMLKKGVSQELEKNYITNEEIPAIMPGEHLCWMCSNGYPSKCSKVADRVKGKIDIYDFVKSGYQIVKNDTVARFIVTSCVDYERADDSPKYSGQDFRKEVGKLFTGYYGTETVSKALAENFRQRDRLERYKIKMLY